MPALTKSTDLKIACVNFGGTNGSAQVLKPGTANPLSNLVSLPASKPNSFGVDHRTISTELAKLYEQADGFDAIAFGVAGRVKSGVVTGAGSLSDWPGINIQGILEQDTRVPVLVANDGAMLAADALMFGALRGSEHRGKSGLLVAIGTGIAVTTWFTDDTGRIHIKAGEGAHMTVSLYGNPRRTVKKLANCGCNQPNCVESLASGRLLKAYAAEVGLRVQDLPDEEVYSLLGDTIGAMIANIVNLHPDIEVVLTSGGVIRNRPGLTDILYDTAADRLNGYIQMPTFVQSDEPADGVRGALAYWMLQHGIPVAA